MHGRGRLIESYQAQVQRILGMGGRGLCALCLNIWPGNDLGPLVVQGWKTRGTAEGICLGADPLSPCGSPMVKREGGVVTPESRRRSEGGLQTGWGERRVEPMGARCRFLTAKACCVIGEQCRGSELRLKVELCCLAGRQDEMLGISGEGKPTGVQPALSWSSLWCAGDDSSRSGSGLRPPSWVDYVEAGRATGKEQRST